MAFITNKEKIRKKKGKEKSWGGMSSLFSSFFFRKTHSFLLFTLSIAIAKPIEIEKKL